VKPHIRVAPAIAVYLSLLGLAAAVAANADEPPRQTLVNVVRNGDVFEIEAQSRVAADRATAWTVLTDYDGYAEFVPGMISSLRVSAHPLRIEQAGEFGILFLVKHVYSTLDVQEEPPSAIRFHAIGGNLRRLETDVNIVQDGDTTVLMYRSTIEPDFWIPPLIGTSILRAAISRKLISVSEEIERRAALEALE
jgi:carbon monoxide dehydrogenase subunit G